MVVQAPQDGGGAVGGVGALPGAGGVRAGAAHGDVGHQHALAARLDPGVGGFHEDREVGVEEFGALGGDLGEAVAVAGDLLAGVEDVTHVMDRGGERGREPQRHRDAALHVAGAEPVEPFGVEAGGQVPGGRDGVQMARDDHAPVAAQPGAGHHGVADPLDRQMRQGAQRALDGVGERGLLAALGRDVDQGAGERDDIGARRIEGGGGGGHRGVS